MSKKSIFWKLNEQSGPRPEYVSRSLGMQAQACVAKHILVYAARVSEV